ncbi:DUF4145 domain-containing protein [Pedobacter duraquae]|uniref:Uncharacterized protein DUF4145 n=1 Tax=Pedobacter duraquae TaxID=425511 RepID=A0A4R6IPA0_9SPHI|nr:DUF4145 domain-containing protein [Pedobacter duraquae]TDO23755.1 uncharacterized protein DUF4145 [Pedobacter duraquae]
MKCPHCVNYINESFKFHFYGNDSDGYWFTKSMNCPNPNCKKNIISLIKSTGFRNDPYGNMIGPMDEISSIYVNPLKSSRPSLSQEVDSKFSKDYNEACLILDFSPKASAALSRRCLQILLREKAGVKPGELAKEIQEIIDSGKLPSHLSESIDAIRNIGNFASHPIKSTSTGEIVDVEAGEAEWLLDVLESLFDFYFVQPALIKAKRDALNQKLSDAGKTPMK